MTKTTDSAAIDAGARWDAMNEAERTAVLHRDRSMKKPRWAALVYAMATQPFRGLSGLQQDAVRSLIAKL